MSTSTVLQFVGETLIKSRNRLNEADSKAGDGDLGNTAASIGEVLVALAPELEGLAPAAALRRVGMEIGAKAPSTFGTLISMGLVGASRTIGAAGQAPDASPTSAEEAARIAKAVELAIAERGKAKRGGKTMLDALGPAVDGLEVAAEAGVSLAEAVALASLGALEGADDTAGMEPTMGRQAWLADRARGSVDPGALAVAIAVRAAADQLAREYVDE